MRSVRPAARGHGAGPLPAPADSDGSHGAGAVGMRAVCPHPSPPHLSSLIRVGPGRANRHGWPVPADLAGSGRIFRQWPGLLQCCPPTMRTALPVGPARPTATTHI